MIPYPLLLFTMSKSNKKPQNRKIRTFDIRTSDVLITDVEPPKNMKRFNHFLSNVQSRKRDNVRIIEYDKEGYPMIKALDYDGKSIRITAYKRFRDPKRDKSVYRASGHQINMVEEGRMNRYYLYNHRTNEKIKVLEVKKG